MAYGGDYCRFQALWEPLIVDIATGGEGGIRITMDSACHVALTGPASTCPPTHMPSRP